MKLQHPLRHLVFGRGAAPVPISPIAAKRTEPDFPGRMTSCARNDGAYRLRNAERRKVRRRIVRILLLSGQEFKEELLGHEIDYDDFLGYDVLQYETMAQ